jgi:hypothetical protein
VFFDRGQADDGEGVVREAESHYGHERALQSARGQILNARGQILTSPGRPAVERGGRKVVPERVRITALAESSRCSRRGSPASVRAAAPHRAAASHRAAATQPRTSWPTEADGGSTSAASGRAARGSRASAGRPGARGSRPPPRRG